jgi:putative oxidoreductase
VVFFSAQKLKFSHMNNASLSKIATIAYALVIIVFGVTHFINTQEMRNFVPAFVPGGGIWVYITGTLLILAGIAILLNMQTRLAGILLAILLLSFALTIHLPKVLDGNSSGVGQIMKDIGLAAGALLIASRSQTSLK